MTRRIFIDNIGSTTTKEMLEELFKASGPVESVVIPVATSLKEKITHAFVVMETETAAYQAIQRLNNTKWNGNQLSVSHAGPVGRAASGFGGGVPRRETKDRKVL